MEIVYLNVQPCARKGSIIAQALELPALSEAEGMLEKADACFDWRNRPQPSFAARAWRVRWARCGAPASSWLSGRFAVGLMRRVVENARVDNLEAMFARYNRLEADREGYFQDYDLSSYEAVETVSRRKTVVVEGPVSGEQLALL